ncbi:hypothetical protein [Streptomyces sp. NPDC051561]|uniref:hypothetical protein n=1 Tax=Streptomyces sp. NPDC051561 TaxID=3365658 RepID=UPI003789A2E4
MGDEATGGATSGEPGEEQRVQAAVLRYGRERAFAEAEDVISALLADPGMQQAGRGSKSAETELGTELCGHLQSFQDRYDQAVRDGDAVDSVTPGSYRALPTEGRTMALVTVFILVAVAALIALLALALSAPARRNPFPGRRTTRVTRRRAAPRPAQQATGHHSR